MRTVTVAAPPSKSLSHRNLIAAALATGLSRLEHVLESDDSARTMDCLTTLGARFERLAPGLYSVLGTGGRIGAPGNAPLSLFVGESGTTCRLITALVAAGSGSFHIHGAGRMHLRPIGELTRCLEELGAAVTFLESPDCPPLVLEANSLDASALPECTATIGCDESSQYLSGLLLAAPLTPQGLRIRLEGRKAVSWPYVSLTLDTLEACGIEFFVEFFEENNWHKADWRGIQQATPGRLRFTVSPGQYLAGQRAVEGDYSGASYFLAAGAIGPDSVRVLGLKRDSLQADAAVLPLLERMGATVSWDDKGVTVSPGTLRGIKADMGQCPDIVPTMAAVAARAAGPSLFYNAAHLAAKESNRLEAPARELRKAGCRVDVLPDGLRIEPREAGLVPLPSGEIFSAHNDHRMAMSLALLELAGPKGDGITVALDNWRCVAKSFPDFWEKWHTVTGKD